MMVSRISVLVSLVFSIWLVPGDASAGTTICDFQGSGVLYEDRGEYVYYPAYRYHCRDGGDGYIEYVQFSNMVAYPDAVFTDEDDAWIWLARKEGALAPLRLSLIPGAGNGTESAEPVLGQILDAEVVGVSMLQLGVVSITMLPQFRVLKALRWMLEAPDPRHVSRQYRRAQGIPERGDRRR